jgi:hypothetical protein
MEMPQHVTASNLAAARPDLAAPIGSKVYFATSFLGLRIFLVGCFGTLNLDTFKPRFEAFFLDLVHLEHE